jgi:hypothetical protein
MTDLQLPGNEIAQLIFFIGCTFNQGRQPAIAADNPGLRRMRQQAVLGPVDQPKMVRDALDIG